MRTKPNAVFFLLAAFLCIAAAAEDYTSASAPVRLEAYEGALVTGAYWATDSVRVETWCERRFARAGKSTPVTTRHWTFSSRDEAPKPNANPERMVNVKFRLDPVPEPTL